MKTKMFLATQIVNSTGRTGENGMICWQHRSRIWDVTIRKRNLRWTKNTNVSHPISCYDENHICQSTLCHVFFVPPCPPPPQSQNKTTSVWRKTSAESASTAVDSQKHPSIIMPNTLNFALQKSRRFELDSYKQQEKKTLTQETPDPHTALFAVSHLPCGTKFLVSEAAQFQQLAGNM